MTEFKETCKMKVVQINEQTPNQLLNPTPTPKPPHSVPKKTKTTRKLSQNQMSEFRESQKMKVVQLHQWTPKFSQNQMSEFRESQKIKVVQLNEYIPKIANQGPKDNNDPKIKSNLNVRIQGIVENESCSTT